MVNCLGFMGQSVCCKSLAPPLLAWKQPHTTREPVEVACFNKTVSTKIGNMGDSTVIETLMMKSQFEFWKCESLLLTMRRLMCTCWGKSPNAAATPWRKIRSKVMFSLVISICSVWKTKTEHIQAQVTIAFWTASSSLVIGCNSLGVFVNSHFGC